jgi:hypothetical protein
MKLREIPVKRPLNPQCRRSDEISYRIPSPRGLIPVQGLFSGSSSYLDRVMRPRRVAAQRKIGAPTRAARDLVRRTTRECPWQIYEDPETGQTRIERRYDPQEEPLYEGELEFDED